MPGMPKDASQKWDPNDKQWSNLNASLELEDWFKEWDAMPLRKRLASLGEYGRKRREWRTLIRWRSLLGDKDFLAEARRTRA